MALTDEYAALVATSDNLPGPQVRCAQKLTRSCPGHAQALQRATATA